MLAAPVDQQSEPEVDTLEQERALATVEELRSAPLTSEEEQILEGFEAFRREHPFSLSSLAES